MRDLRLPLYGAVALAAFLADFLAKRMVEARLDMHSPLEVLPFLALYRTYNTGIAFSMLDGLGVSWLVLLHLAILGLVIHLALRTPADHVLARSGFALIVGGAIGNLYDRATLGYVIDYFLFFIGNWSFAIFNLADAFLTVGAGLVLLQEAVAWRRARRHRS